MKTSPVLSTIGVNPDILQFYLSTIDEKVNILQGSFHHWYISGMITEVSHFSATPYITLTIPFLHKDSRNLHFALSSEDNYNSIENTRELSYYAYVVDIDPLPRLRHSFDCGSCDIDADDG